MKMERTVETTLGNLIVALTDETSEYVRDEQQAYKVVAFMLAHLLNDTSAATRSSRYSN